MEYDENDFQSQKFQLVGEESKFSANLPTFSLPKFDLDEHLRFDSLVETEVLLGIQGQGNNWIDFPSGSSAVEFSSSAAESCSISRHNNVWSEATSSESVDLLLKSVGEDEIMNSKAVIMESSANDGSHGFDNQFDLYVKKDNAHNSSMMNVLPSDQDIIIQDECPEKLPSSPSEGQRELLPHLQDSSSQASEVEESRTVFNLDPSGGKFSSDGKITGDQCMAEENVTSLDDAIEKSRVAEEVLCETVLNEGDVCDVLMRTSASNIDDCDSCVVACHNPLSITCRSNQDERLIMETTKLTGLFSDKQNQRSISSISGLPFANAQKEKSMVIHSDETNIQLVPQSDALELMKKSSDSVSEDTDGLMSISRQTKYLICDGETGNNFFGKQDDVNQLAKEQGTKFENNSGNISCKAILKSSSLTEGDRSVSGRLPDDSVEDDDVYSIRNQNSTMSYDDRGGKLVTCLDAFSNKQYPECQMTENNKTNVIASQLLTESHASIQVNYKIQGSETGEDDSMMTNPLNMTCVKYRYVVEAKTAEEMNVDRQEMKLDADKDIAPDESSLLAVVSDAETKSTPSTYCKVGKSDTDSAEVHMAQADILVDKESSVPFVNDGRVSLGMVSNVVEKVQGTSPAVWQTAEALSLDGFSGIKMIQEKIDSVPLSLDFEKSMHLHLQPPDDTTDVDVVVEKKEPLIEALSTSDVVHSANKDVKLLRGPASSLPINDLVSMKASDPASVSHPFIMEDTSPGKLSQDDSGAKLASQVKSTNSQLSQCIAAFNITTQQKEELSSSLAIPDLFVSKENELKLSGGSKLTNSRNYVVKETMNVPDTGSDCVEDALVNTSTKNEASSVVQHPSLVEGIVCTPFQNTVPSSAVDAIGNGKSALLEGNGSHGYGEGIDDSVKSLEGFSHARNETSVLSGLAQTSCSDGRHAVYFPSSIDDKCSCSPTNGQNDQCNFAPKDFSDGQNVSAQTEDYVLIRPTNDSSQICIVRTVESNPSEKQSENPSSSERNCGSPIVISRIQCSRDSLEHQEDKVLQLESNLRASGNMDLVSSAKNEITQKLECNSNDLKPPSTSVEVRSFTFEVSTSGNLSESGDGSECKSFPSLQLTDIPQMLKENSEGCLQEVKTLDTSAKTPKKGKTTNATRPSNETKTGSRGKAKKEAPALKQSCEMDAKYSSGTHKYVEISSKDLPFVGMRENSSVECCNIKTSSSLVVQTSSIPDLNSSSSSPLFQQPFTDLQQVQLRAQIFVYGALISGLLPDEAYMVSAFGDADGGQKMWEGIWHSLIAKFQNQKSPVSGYETPLHSRSVGTNVQSQVPGSSAAKSSSKIISSAVLNSTVPFPSPLWSHSYGNGHNASTPRGAYLNFSQTPSPLTPWRPSQSRHLVDASNPWFSQSSHPGPWFVSSHSSALDGVKQHSMVSFTETRHVTSARDLCGPHIPTIQVAPPSALMSVADPTSTTTVTVLPMETTKKTETSGSSKHTSKSQKARKMKKRSTEEPCLHVSQTSVESISAISGVESLPLSAGMLLSSNLPVKVASDAPVSISMSHIISPTNYQIICDSSNQHKTNFSEETCSNIELAKLQAEDAAALAAVSVKHSQAIWSQLVAQKNSGLVSHIEEKLAFAAVTASVAASVAKAAAAAAKVAYDVALQAKIMADEAISAAKTCNTVRSPESGILDVGKKLAGITSISILKGMDKIHESVEVISAAREAAKRRIESASAATKQAENLDAIVKAAELAAEAVAQAGTIIAMGDPLPCTLGELVNAGPEEFWKAHHVASMKVSKWSNIHGEEHVGLSNAKESAKQFDEQFSKDEQTQKTASEGGLSSLIKCHEQFDGIAQGNFPLTGHESDNSVGYSGLQKGSLVEVMSDEDGRRGAWFSARVLDMKDNKAYVCYNDVSTKEGHLTEWIALENEGEKAPRIRTANFAAAMKYEGTRKRRRENVGSYIWELGDHVDIWIHDRWWEGTVAEKSTGDETKLTVYFPAKGDKQVVHAWNVRPSLIWKDGQWMEWSYLRGKSFKPYEGDTPQEKRQRLGRLDATTPSEVDTVGMSKISKNMLIEVSRKPEESRSLVLSAKDRAFSIGKNSREESTSNAHKTKRTGVQKEGSRVVFGVPRPGKKRKFMEVSKHYVAGKCEKVSESSDPIKFAKYLMPRASQKFKNTSKVDSKGKKPGESRSKVGVKAENSQSFQTRSQTEKGNALLTASNGETRPENHEDAVSSFSANNNSLGKMNTFKFGSSSRQAVKSNVQAVESESSVQLAPNAPLSKKKNVPGSESDSAVKAKPNLNRTSKGEGKGSESDSAVKAKPNLNRTSKGEGKGLGNHGNAMEPRRSNRRIQPTSRLLEGIQSSLIVSKIPSISHEKKTSRGNLHG